MKFLVHLLLILFLWGNLYGQVSDSEHCLASQSVSKVVLEFHKYFNELSSFYEITDVNWYDYKNIVNKYRFWMVDVIMYTHSLNAFYFDWYIRFYIKQKTKFLSERIYLFSGKDYDVTQRHVDLKDQVASKIRETFPYFKDITLTDDIVFFKQKSGTRKRAIEGLCCSATGKIYTMEGPDDVLRHNLIHEHFHNILDVWFTNSISEGLVEYFTCKVLNEQPRDIYAPFVELIDILKNRSNLSDLDLFNIFRRNSFFEIMTKFIKHHDLMIILFAYDLVLTNRSVSNPHMSYVDDLVKILKTPVHISIDKPLKKLKRIMYREFKVLYRQINYNIKADDDSFTSYLFETKADHSMVDEFNLDLSILSAA